METANLEISKAIRELRALRGLSQEKFGAEFGLSQVALHRWELGTFRPKPGALAKLYRMARENGRDDLAGVFLRSGNPPAPNQQATTMLLEVLPLVKDFIADAQSSFAQAIADPTLTKEKRGELFDTGFEHLEGSMKFIAKVMQEARG